MLQATIVHVMDHWYFYEGSKMGSQGCNLRTRLRKISWYAQLFTKADGRVQKSFFFSFSFDWRVSFSTSFPKITRWQLKVMHLFPFWLTSAQPRMSRISFAGKNAVLRDYLWETIIFKVCGLLPKGKEGGIYQMMMLKNCTHQYEYKVFCDP